MIKKNQVELLAPTGDEECFKAAIAAGADAVYFGMEQFSARTRAKNITVEQAKYLVPLAHEHNCRAYLTLNTLITDDEIPSALSLVEKAVECGIDAVIIQDLGILNIVHKSFPSLELHASTQMTTHNLSQCKFLSELGVSQINLSRELSLPEIQKITELLHSKNIVPEIFVQGAFCISYSGQCYLSGHLYNQAGNRGDCVQPCRRTWTSETVCSKPLFHLKDNSAFPIADKLIKENIPVSLKIEGRIKNAEYVWAVTSAWREQIDLLISEKPILKSSPKLTGAINRDYTCGYLEGNISSQMFSSGTKDISQIKAGTVKNYIADSKTLVLNDDDGKLVTGDRLTIKTSGDRFICTAIVTGKNSGGYSIRITNKLTNKILNGQIIYKSSSAISPEELSKIISQFDSKKGNKNCCDGRDGKLHTAHIYVTALENQSLEITYESENQQVTVKSEQILVKARNAGLTEETLKEKLTKLGGTCFVPGKTIIKKLEPGLFISLGELNNLRRKAVELLEEKINENCISENPTAKKIDLKIPFKETKKTSVPQEAFLIDSQEDLSRLLLEKTYGEKKYKIIFELPSAINIVKEDLFDLLNENPDVVLYFNSILMDKDLEESLALLKKLSNPQKREILCDNTGLAYELKDLGFRIILGPNCNIYNSWNIQEYNENLKLSGIIPSLELKTEAVDKLSFPENIEIWYPKKLNILLMQSRQCLVKNGSGCTKNSVDRKCIETCSKGLLLTGTQKEKIIAMKRPGFYSALYTAKNDIPLSENLKEKISVWIIDRRNFSF